MSFSLDSWSKVEARLVSLAAELLLAKPDSDAALVALYSLVAEMEGDLVSSSALVPAVRTVKVELEKLLDHARPLDRAALAELNRFVSWMRQAVAAEKAGATPTEFGPIRLGSTTTVAPLEVEPLPPDALLEIDLANSRPLLVDFHAETVEHLEAIERAALALEQDRANRESLDAAFRAFHSIKGNAGLLGLRPLQLIAHEVESVLDWVRQGRLAISSPLIDQVLRGRDAMVTLVDQVAAALATGEPPTAIVPIRAMLQVIRELPRTEGTGDSRTPFAAASPVAITPSAQVSSQTIRVPIERLNRLGDVVGELVILRNALAASAVGTEVESLARQLTRVSTEIEQLTRALKRVPIQPAFQKMERLARDLAQSFGKQVGLVLSGGETELDRSLVEGLSDPLMHMMRNALDHGIELPADRRLAGKPESGTVALRAYQRANDIIVELEDDGRGIDPDRVYRVAVERGLIAADAKIDRAQILELIFAPGFSMAEKVTAVSGRGVGMDVLKRNIDRLGGRIELHAVVGAGTTFRIILPLEVPTVVVHVFQSRDEKYAVTADAVIGTAELEWPADAGPEARPIVSLQGEVLPVYHLGADGAVESVGPGITGGPALVIGSHGRRLALLTAGLLGRQEVVVSNQRSRLRRKRFEAGVATLADGSEATLINLFALVLEAPPASP